MILKNSCCKLHCQKASNLILFSYRIGGLRRSQTPQFGGGGVIKSEPHEALNLKFVEASRRLMTGAWSTFWYLPSTGTYAYPFSHPIARNATRFLTLTASVHHGLWKTLSPGAGDVVQVLYLQRAQCGQRASLSGQLLSGPSR